jgi:hypothetical protein
VKTSLIAALILVIVLGVGSASSQEEAGSGLTGILKGQVVHQTTREPLPGATVQILETTFGGSTDPDGRFTVAGVPVGTYSVRVALVGYGPVVLTDIVIRTARPAEIIARLDETEITIEGVEVTAKYFQTTPDAPVSLQRLTAEEIRRSPGGFEDVLRAVSVLPGVAQASPGRNDLVVRGGAPSENLFVVNNIEIPNINHFGTQGASGGPLSFVNLDFVNETAFSTGGFGVRYGDRLSSVLTIDLKDGREETWGGKATIAATQFGLNLEGPISESGSVIFSARRSYLDFIFKAAGFGFVPEYWDFLGKVTYRLDRSNSISALGIAVIDNVNYFNETADQRYQNSQVQGSDQRQYVGGVSWQHVFTGGFLTTALGQTSVDYVTLQRDSLLNPIFTNSSTEDETNFRSDLVLQPSRTTEVAAGIQAKVLDFNTTMSLPGYVTPYGDTIGFSLREGAQRGTNASAYLQVTKRFMSAVEVTAGVRGQNLTLIDDTFTFSPRLSVTYRFSELTSLAAGAGVYRQSPSSIWLASNDANRRLKQIRADQYVLSMEHLLRADLRVRLEGYHKEYRDYAASIERPYLVLANTGAGFGGTEDDFSAYGFDNLVSEGRGRSDGIEVLLQKKLSEIPVYGIASLTVSTTRFTARDGIERPGSYDQRVLFNISGGYRFDERWEVSARFRFGTGQPYTPFNADGSRDVARYNTERLESAHSLDLRADRRWNFARWDLVVYLDIQNVYNNKNTGAVRWNAREQKVESDESAIGILPSIGVSAEF